MLRCNFDALIWNQGDHSLLDIFSNTLRVVKNIDAQYLFEILNSCPNIVHVATSPGTSSVLPWQFGHYPWTELHCNRLRCANTERFLILPWFVDGSWVVQNSVLMSVDRIQTRMNQWLESFPLLLVETTCFDVHALSLVKAGMSRMHSMRIRDLDLLAVVQGFSFIASETLIVDHLEVCFSGTTKEELLLSFDEYENQVKQALHFVNLAIWKAIHITIETENSEFFGFNDDEPDENDDAHMLQHLKATIYAVLHTKATTVVVI
jgi:hypothetical protein